MTDPPHQPFHRPHLAVIVAASATGVLTGVVVLAIEHLVEDIVEEIFHGPVWLPAVSVVLGAALTVVIVRMWAGAKSATTEVYVEDFHADEPTLEPKHTLGRLLGAVATLGSGAPLGMEGPAVYAGASIATVFRRRWPALVAQGANTLLVAGAAAGVAAVFKAPLAGAIFAFEVPYRGRLAGERLLPALFGSTTGYLTLAVVEGVKPELPLPAVELTLRRLSLAAVLGVAVGVAAIGVIALIRAAERITAKGNPWLNAVVAGSGLAAIYGIGRGVSGESIGLGSGNQVIEWALSPDHGIWLLLAVLLLRVAGPAASIAGGGVGGLFIPLMAIGAVLGRLFADAVSNEEITLFVMVGASTMLGAGYAAPLTGVVFVAEYTGQASFVVPSLIATTVAIVVVGQRSVSHAQRD